MAQTFLCVTLPNADSAKTIAELMYLAHGPNVYLASGIPHWVCVGDINDTDAQEKRGGGTVTFICDPLWQSLIKALSDKPEPPKKPGAPSKKTTARTPKKKTSARSKTAKKASAKKKSPSKPT